MVSNKVHTFAAQKGTKNTIKMFGKSFKIMDKAQIIENKIKLHKEMELALCALENNPNVDVFQLSRRLHNLHLSIIKDIQELADSCQKTPSMETIFFIIEGVEKGFFTLKYTEEFNLFSVEVVDKGDYWIYVCTEFNYDTMEDELCPIPFQKILFFQWDEECETGYQGEEPVLSSFKDEEFEQKCISLGLEYDYFIERTYHSREVVVRAKRPSKKP